MTLSIKIVGVSGSPRKGGNTDLCLQQALDSCSNSCATELISLASLEIAECDGCERCRRVGTASLPCPAYDDDMTPLYSRIASADAFIFASPVYYGSVSGILKIFMDRFMPFYDDSESKSPLRGALRLKPAGAIAVGGGRNDGIEAVIQTLHKFFLYNDMIIVSTTGHPGVPTNFGGTVVTDGKPNAAIRDELGRNSLRVLGRKVSHYAEQFAQIRH